MNHLKNLLASLCLVFIGLEALQAQSDVLTSGGDYSGTGGSVAFSIGQTVYSNYNGSGGSTSLGVQQPYVIIMVGTNDPHTGISAAVYPNPVSSSVNLKIDNPSLMNGKDDISFGVYDVNGKLIQHQEINTTLTSISMDGLPNALYLLRVTKNNSEIKSFKIFKTN